MAILETFASGKSLPNVIHPETKMTIIDIDKSLRLGEVKSPNSPMSREEAIAKLKEAKDLLDLELMEESDYLKMKEELTPIIMGT